MRRFYLTFTGVSAAVMCLLPLLAVRLLPGDMGMAACLLLFWAVNPLGCVLLGVWAGRVRGWYAPTLPPVLFLTAVWLFFTTNEPLFILYAGIYLALGYAALGVTVLLRRSIKHQEAVSDGDHPA